MSMTIFILIYLGMMVITAIAIGYFSNSNEAFLAVIWPVLIPGFLFIAGINALGKIGANLSYRRRSRT